MGKTGISFYYFINKMEIGNFCIKHSSALKVLKLRTSLALETKLYANCN